jgi:hypothetical protein
MRLKTLRVRLRAAEYLRLEWIDIGEAVTEKAEHSIGLAPGLKQARSTASRDTKRMAAFGGKETEAPRWGLHLGEECGWA